MKTLLPLDVVHPVKPIIDQLVELVPLADAEVRLLYVKEALPSYESVVQAIGEFPDDWDNQLDAKARKTFSEAEDLLKSRCARVSTEIVSGPAAMMIEAVARDEHCDMTVLTPGARGIVEKFFLGSVSSKVVKHGPGTIMICRPQAVPSKPLKNVLIALDGSDNSRSALNKALKLFRIADPDVRVTLVHVVSISEAVKLITPVEFVSRVEQNMVLEGETFLADGKRILSEAGLSRVDTVLKDGEPASEIIDIANALPADLIVLGAQGHTAVQHFLMGSVSHRIATHSPCSVAVVKPDSK